MRHVSTLLVVSYLAAFSLANSFVARQASNPNNTISCGLEELQCCDTVALASAPMVSNALGLEGVPIPTDPDEIVGLNCTDIPSLSANESIATACPALIVCCAQTGLGYDGAVSENCTYATTNYIMQKQITPHRRPKYSSPVQKRGLDGNGASILTWRGGDLGWVPDDDWGLSVPLIFHAVEDDGLQPVDFSLRSTYKPQPSSAIDSPPPAHDERPRARMHTHSSPHTRSAAHTMSPPSSPRRQLVLPPSLDSAPHTHASHSDSNVSPISPSANKHRLPGLPVHSSPPKPSQRASSRKDRWKAYTHSHFHERASQSGTYDASSLELSRPAPPKASPALVEEPLRGVDSLAGTLILRRFPRMVTATGNSL